ncbi:hypothetical protein B7494_g4372 [Chlorociboria aeruginascens]|nr:hypothetical protein B7494_g4372 [Chlorociboria aeruginascens]
MPWVPTKAVQTDPTESDAMATNDPVISSGISAGPGPDPTTSLLPKLKVRVTSSHTLSSASSAHSTSSSRKGRQRTSGTAVSFQKDISPSRRSINQEVAVEGANTPKLDASTMGDESNNPTLLDLAIRPRPSISEMDSKRVSVSSMYSLGSVRAGGVPSSAGSTNGSEVGMNMRSPSQNKGLGIYQPETSTSTVSITTSSGQSGSQTSAGGPQLTPRESPAIASDMAKRNAISRGEGSSRTQPPTRSRSRAKRRFSGSTGASSHSPSSERGPHGKKDEETKRSPLGVIGVCALDIKARSKPSRNILNRLMAKGEFEVIVFGDKVILDEEIENWPICDFLISFYSDGFPLDKAVAYVKARKPFCVNDVPMQRILWDRRICLRILDQINVPSPKRVEVNRDGGPAITTPELAQHLKQISGVVLPGPEDGTGGGLVAPRKVELLDEGDTLSVDGTLLAKPFVEKPISGEDHNICIYFPKSQGGGARKLFRKIGNKSSEWVENLTVPRAILEPESSYLYEKFMRVDNSEDVKAYTVGPNFCHAETRKSPVVDGLVRRNTHGKEIRYITSLKEDEIRMASRIATSFGQRVCGFDLLRAGGKSYVIDVNGWSFVKDNDEYYNQCSKVLREMFIAEKQKQSGWSNPGTALSSPAMSDFVTSPPLGRKEGAFKDHRTSIQSIISKSPSLSKLHHQHAKIMTPSSAAVSAAPTPKTSPSLGPEKGLPNMLATIPLPPPATSPLPIAGMPSSAPSTVPSTPALNSTSTTDLLPPPAPKHTWKLKGMVSVIRHADRTPKQKYKFTFHTAPFIELLKGYQEEVLLTGEAALGSVVIAVDMALKEGVEDRKKLRTLRNVLAKKGGWPGTKVQIKPMFRKRNPQELTPDDILESGLLINASQPAGVVESKLDPPISASESKDLSNMDGPEGNKPKQLTSNKARVPSDLPETLPSLDGAAATKIEENIDNTNHSKSPTRQDSLSGVTLSRITAAENSLVLDKLQLIVKWGGEPTHSARYQAQELGENMRNDLLLMNREVLDEVHVFSSSERRVTTSAQIWSSSFTEQKDLPPDFITIRKDLLDDSNAAKDEMDKVKKKLKTLLRQGNKAPPQFAWPPNMPEPSMVQRYVVQLMKFHRRVMRHNYTKLYGGASSSLNAIANPGDKSSNETSSMGSAMSQATATSSIQARWCCGEDAELFKERWEKLFSEFCDADKVDPSKISELYDTMKFDALHNRQFLEWVFTPSKSILAEEEEAIAQESKGFEKEKEQPRESEDSHTENHQPLPTERSDVTRGLHRRVFRRRSMLNGAKNDEVPEQYFRLFTGSSQTKAKTDIRLEKLRELYKLAKVLFDFICPQEYGMTDSEKLEIGLLTSLPLLQEIVQDLEEMQASDEAKSFFYFTKESHIYTLLNCILEGGIETKIKRSAIPELDYLSHICFELYESENKTPADAPPTDAAKYAYSIRITISPGCHTYDPLDVQLDSKHCISCAPRRSLTAHQDWKEVVDTLRAKFHTIKLPKSFLAVNLSESHTFHKKDSSEDEATIAQLLED